MNHTKYLSDVELKALKDNLERFRDSDTRNVLLLELLLATGARASEILKVKLSDLNTVEKSVYLRGAKRSNNRQIPLAKDLFNRLFTYASGKTEEIFEISYDRLGQIWRLYRPVDKGVHSLRHTFAIRVYKKSRDILLVRQALGHRDLRNTLVYANYITETEQFRKFLG